MLVELSVMEVVSGAPVTEVARRYGVPRQAVHGWRSTLTPAVAPASTGTYPG